MLGQFIDEISSYLIKYNMFIFAYIVLFLKTQTKTRGLKRRECQFHIVCADTLRRISGFDF